MALGYFDGASTPEQLARRRAELDFLSSGMGRAQNFGQGVGDILRGVGVGLGRYRANKTENAGIEAANTKWSAFNPFQSAPTQAPQVSGGEAFPNPAALPAQAQQTPTAQAFGGNSGVPVSKSIPASALLQKPVQQSPVASDGKWLNYANQSAVRNKPLNPKLEQGLSFLPEMGVSMQVFSGGQDAKGQGNRRTGSTRHDHGNSADVFFERNGKKLDWRNPADIPVLQEIVSRAKANGVTGFGAGEGYMQPGSMHIGLGSPAVWGAGGKGENAPEWLRQAYSTPYKGNAQAPVQVTSNDPQFTPASAPPQDVSQETMQQPIQQPQQVAQGGDDQRLQWAAEMMNSQFLDDGKKNVAKMIFEQEMKKRDPAYKMRMESDQLGLEKSRLEIDALKNPKPKPIEVGGRLIDPETYQPLYEPPVDTNDAGEWGLQPIPVRDPKTGQLKLMITSKSGVQKLMEMPQGYEAAPNLQYLDTGTGFQPVDKRGGAIPDGVSPVSKDVAGEAAANTSGKLTAEANVALPGAETKGAEALSMIQQLADHPSLASNTGAIEGRAPAVLQDLRDPRSADFRARLEQVKGQSFLSAFEALKGAGAITEQEGAAATRAMARLDQAQSGDDFKTALKDLQQIIVKGIFNARVKAGKEKPAPSTVQSKPVEDMTDAELEALVNGQ